MAHVAEGINNLEKKLLSNKNMDILSTNIPIHSIVNIHPITVTVWYIP